jgi:hypothetical protein
MAEDTVILRIRKAKMQSQNEIPRSRPIVELADSLLYVLPLTANLLTR